MKREFVMTEWFDSSWDELNLTDEHLRMLQIELLQDPKSGDVMRGTGRFRKKRYPLPGCGKSGGIRVIYLDIQEYKTLYLVFAYAKNVKDTLNTTETNELKVIATNIKRNLQEEKGDDTMSDMLFGEMLIQSVKQAEEHSAGKKKLRAKAIEIKPVPDYGSLQIKEIRAKLGLTQGLMGGIIEVSPKTIEAWEAGIRKPSGAAMRVIEELDTNPNYFNKIAKVG